MRLAATELPNPADHRSAHQPRESFRKDVLEGLARHPRAIPARWFYDLEGSKLFEAITTLPEYYPTRTERDLLADHATEIVALAGKGRAVVEFGSGSSSKTPLLLSAMSPAAYVPIDISGDFLRQSAAELARTFPQLPIHPVEADFTRSVTLPKDIEGIPQFGFFPGSTIGNLSPRAATDLLRNMAETLRAGMLLIGIDRLKPASIMIPAYDDAQGVTAKFNMNLLQRINRELKGLIPLDAFRHQACWNDLESRIEMHLIAVRDTRFVVDGHAFSISAGETIHTENSYKYGPRDVRLLLRAGGWTPIQEWTDADGMFSIYLAKECAEPPAP